MAHAAASPTLSLVRISGDGNAHKPRAHRHALANGVDLDEMQDREETLALRRLVADKRNRDRTNDWR